MSQKNLELVRHVYEAFAEGDLDRMFAGLDAEIEWDVSRRLVDPGVYRGHEGVGRFLAGLRSVWSLMRQEPERYIDAGDSVVVTVRAVNVGRGSGIEVIGRASWVWDVRAGAVVRVTMYQTEAEALQAVGQET